MFGPVCVCVCVCVCTKWVSCWLATLCEASGVNDGDNGEGKYCIGVNTSELAKRLWHCLKYGRPLDEMLCCQAYQQTDTVKNTRATVPKDSQK